MSLWTRLLNLRRADEPRHVETARIPWQKIAAGVRVDADTAITVPAVWACLRYLSQTVAVLPWHVMRDEHAGGVVARSHPVDWLLWKRPNPEWSSFQFRETLTHWALRHGNGYAEIERDALGRPMNLWPLHPVRVDPMRPEGGGALFYRIDGKTDLAAADVFHIRGFGEGPAGLSVIEYAAQSIGWAKAAQIFGAAFFGNGMHMGGMIKTKAGLTPKGKEALDKELKRKHGGPGRANAWPILDGDLEFVPVTTDPQKGQFLETQQHLVTEICRWFGVPPHKVSDLSRATFSNIEHQAIEVVQDSILPWVKRFEDEADYKLFGAQNRLGHYTKINLMGLLRGDFKSQAEGFRVYREMGVVNADEIRDRLDMNRMQAGTGGEKYTMQSQYTTLERVGEEVAAPEPPPALAPAEDDVDEVGAQGRIGALLAAMEPVHAI